MQITCEFRPLDDSTLCLKSSMLIKPEINKFNWYLSVKAEANTYNTRHLRPGDYIPLSYIVQMASMLAFWPSGPGLLIFVVVIENQHHGIVSKPIDANVAKCPHASDNETAVS